MIPEEYCAQVRKSEFIEMLLHMMFANNHKQYEWFMDVDMKEFKYQLSMWADYTHTAYIARWNPNSGTVIAAASGWREGQETKALQLGGPSRKKAKRTSDGMCSASSARSEAGTSEAGSMTPGAHTLTSWLATGNAM